jgi:NAD(P)-dependent dehydrogenase (short-subunit alcohol dehydrogenase family)
MGTMDTTGIRSTGAVVVVTGAGRGIGAGLARRFAADGAVGLVLVDRDSAAVAALADEISGTRPACRTSAAVVDVADPDQVARLVQSTESTIGPIDVFVANAGVGAGGGLEADDSVWRSAWDVNVMAHVYAARAVVPLMLARGGGSFVTTASAAGLLTNLGNAPYSVTKHAAVAFAEWLAVTYGERGLQVACVCPMGVDTDMLRDGLDRLEGASVAAERVLTVPEAADAIVDGLRSGRFLVLTHPETAGYEQHRVADRDRWIAGMQRVQRTVLERLGG